ncbi:MAG: hypothetical protein Q9159_007464 [Coniocarpon cinnabarinum]
MAMKAPESPQVKALESGSESSPADQNIEQGNAAVLLRVDNEKGVPLKLARDGHVSPASRRSLRAYSQPQTVLVPQPSEDPNDPLNWSWAKKHIILFILALSAFCGDFGSGAGIPCIVLQGEEWGLSPNHVNYSGNLNVLMIALLDKQLDSLSSKTCSTSTSMHARLDFGPGYSCNFILAGTGDWRNVFWMVFGVCAFDLALIVLFADETWYRRDIPQQDQPNRGSRLTRLLGIWQIQHHHGYFISIFSAYYRVFAVVIKPVVLPTLFYYALSFMWSVGINITSALLLQTPPSEGGYGFTNNGVGYMYFTPVVAITLGEIFGHYFNDFLADRFVKRHGGIFKPEARLPACYLGAFFMIPGLILLGQALQKHLLWVGIMFGWGMFVFGVMIASVAVTAFLLDCYQNGSGEVGGFINLARTLSGFTVGYFQQPWGLKDGFDVSFGVQAALVAVGTVILTFIYLFGERMRLKGGPLKFKGSA